METRRPIGPRAARPSLDGDQPPGSVRRRDAVLPTERSTSPDRYQQRPEASARGSQPDRRKPSASSQSASPFADPVAPWTDAGTFVESPETSSRGYSQAGILDVLPDTKPRLVQTVRREPEEDLPYTRPHVGSSHTRRPSESGASVQPPVDNSDSRRASATRTVSASSGEVGPRGQASLKGPRPAPTRPRTVSSTSISDATDARRMTPDSEVPPMPPRHPFHQEQPSRDPPPMDALGLYTKPVRNLRTLDSIPASPVTPAVAPVLSDSPGLEQPAFDTASASRSPPPRSNPAPPRTGQQPSRGGYQLHDRPMPQKSVDFDGGSASQAHRRAHARAATDTIPASFRVQPQPPPEPFVAHSRQQTVDVISSRENTIDSAGFMSSGPSQASLTSMSESSGRTPLGALKAIVTPKRKPTGEGEQHVKSKHSIPTFSPFTKGHVKGKTSASSIGSPPGTQTQFVNATGNMSGNRELGWARVRSVVKHQLPQPRSKQFLQMFGVTGFNLDTATLTVAPPVAGHGRSGSVGQPMSKLEEEVMRAVWHARFGVPKGRSANATMDFGSSFAAMASASTPHLGMTGASPPTTASSSMQNFTLPLASTMQLGLSSALGRRAMMIGTHAPQAPTPTAQPKATRRATPSVRPIIQALQPYLPPKPQTLGHQRNMSGRMVDLASEYNDDSGVGKALLPREDEVLRTLAMPFLVKGPEDWGGAGGRRALDDERWAAFEGFKLVISGWDAPGPKEHFDRCLWLIRAARSRTQDMSERVLNTLEYCLTLSPAAQTWRVDTVATLVSFVAAVAELHSTIASDGALGYQVAALLSKLQDMTIDLDDIELWFGLSAAGIDLQEPNGPWAVQQAVWRDALVRTLELGAPGVKAHILTRLIDDQWDLPKNFDNFESEEGGEWQSTEEMGADFDSDEDALPTPKRVDPPTDFVGSITCNSMLRLLRAMPSLLGAHPDAPSAALRLLRMRMLPFFEVLQPLLWQECRQACVALVLELSQYEKTYTVARQYLEQWSIQVDGNVWKDDLDEEIRHLVSTVDWPAIFQLFRSIPMHFHQPTADRLMALAIPALFRRLVDGVVEPSEQSSVSAFLQRLSEDYPKLFFKPVISCAAAVKDVNLVYQLRVVTTLARLVPDFWVRDADLMAIATFRDGAAAAKVAEGEFGKVRLGQCLLLMQLIADVHGRTAAKKELSSPPLASESSIVKFYMDLETRIALILADREKTALVPFSQRNLAVTLLYEIRLFVWSVKSTPWLNRIIRWTAQALPGPATAAGGVTITPAALEEATSTMEKLKSLMSTAADETQRAKVSLVTTATDDLEHGTLNGEQVAALFNLIPSQLAAGCARLLVLLFQAIETARFQSLATPLWENFVDSDDPSVLEPAAFLFMLAAEKVPALIKQIENDLHAQDRTTRARAVYRLAALFARRYQIMTQTCIYDRRHRPFQTKRTVLTFVPADVGSGQFVFEEDEQALRDRFGSALPRDTIKRLLEIDWVQENKPADKKLELARTPFSALPAAQLDRGLDADPEPLTAVAPSPSTELPHNSSTASLMPSPSASPAGSSQLLRRKSSTSAGGSASKRRPVFVPPLLAVLPQLARTVREADIFISTTARDLLVDFMREDAGHLCRPIMDRISANGMEIVNAVHDIRAFLHVQQILPPVMTHYVFTHLAGFLRSMSKVDRKLDMANSLMTFSFTVPMLAKLVAHVSNLGAQDLRRSKIEIFTLPNGPLWFSSNAPTGPMFPRSLEEVGQVPPSQTLDEIPGALIAITMIRTSQNMLLLSLLKRTPQDIVVVRKNLNRLVLPSRDSTSELKQLVIGDFIPRSAEAMRNKKKDLGLARISLALSRSYLLLVTEVFRCLPRGMSDRAELGRLLDGVNRILLTHGDDIGIVSHALAACMIAAIRFRRLFSNSSAFILFLPSLIKVYCEATEQSAILRAIEYAMSRFYQIHEDVLIYQTLDIASHMAAAPSAPPVHSTLARGVYNLISSLKAPPNTADGDAAGIHGVAEKEEREAYLANLVEKQPESLGYVLQGRTSAEGAPASLPESAAQKTFPLENLPRFLMTVIAYEATTLRAEQFLRLLRCMMPYIYNSTIAARLPLDQGLNSLGLTLFFKAPVPLAQGDGQPTGVFANDYGDGGVLLANPKAPCEIEVMRSEYLGALTAYGKAGGLIINPPAHRGLALVKVMLKDGTGETFRVAERFTVDFIAACHEGNVYSARPAQTQQQLGPYAQIFQQFCDRCDFSRVLAILEELCAIPEFAQDERRIFQNLVVRDFLRPAVHACAKIAAEGNLFQNNLRHTLVPLMNTSLALHGCDPLAALEECSPSPAFLAGVVLPLCLKLQTAADIVDPRIHDSVRDAYSRAWMRILAYALAACRLPVSAESPTADNSGKALPQISPMSSLASLAIVLQIIKIVVIRGEEILSLQYPDVWNIIGSFLLSVLANGDAAFGLSADSDPIRSLSAFTTQSNSTTSQVLHGPRVVDYLMWSMMHFVCAYRSPLMIQMRLRMLECSSSLYETLRRRRGGSVYGLAPASAAPREGRRPTSTMFSKPRVRSAIMSGILPSPGVWTPGHSPNASLAMAPQGVPANNRGGNPFSPRSPDYLTLASPPRPDIRGRNTNSRTFFNGIPRSPGGVSPGGLTDPFTDEPSTPAPLGKRTGIRHLGPASKLSQATIPTTFAPGSTGAKNDVLDQLNKWACAQRVGPELSRACFRHVRKVQMFMGYERTLLPLPDRSRTGYFEVEGSDAVDTELLEEESAAVLSGPQILAMVSRETAQLIEEFRAECYGQTSA